MAKTKRVSYKGIPAKARKPIAAWRKVTAGLNGKAKSPQEILRDVRTEAAKKKREEANNVAKRARFIRTSAIEDLEPALNALADARDLVDWIAREEHGSHFEPSVLARFAQLAIADAGKELEQALCNLGLVDECDCGHFVQGMLKRAGVEKPNGKTVLTSIERRSQPQSKRPRIRWRSWSASDTTTSVELRRLRGLDLTQTPRGR